MGRKENKKRAAKLHKLEKGAHGLVDRVQDQEEKIKKRFRQTLAVIADYELAALEEIKKTGYINEYPEFDKLSAENPETGLRNVLYYKRIKASSTDMDAVRAVIKHKREAVKEPQPTELTDNKNQ
jgi:hypothetical protein